MKMGKRMGMGEGGWRQQNFQLFIIANLLSYKISKKT